ncbi:era-like GTP-binding protein, partial [Phlegmacium glaucopus]
MSTSSKPQLTAEQIRKMQTKFTRFRILVIGRANAGKTTILRRLCNTTGERSSPRPLIHQSVERGQHDIKNEMIFKSNPGFIFHDSRGFEAGSAQELKMVQEFIMERSKAKNVKEQLHAIWYCIPTSDDRPITAAEKKFFNECGTGLVPVIVLWTKTDSLDIAKIKQLMKEGNSRAEAMQQAPQKAWTDFEQSIHQRFEEFKYPPKGYVVFRKMHEPGADCTDLIEKTTAALSSEELQQLFLSTQQNNVELCIKYGVK